MFIHMVLATTLWLCGFALFGRFIAPRWKIFGKLFFYLLVSYLLSIWLGNWALIWIVGHPLLGVAGHIWWCRQNSINWLTCQPRERYLELRPWASSDGFKEKTTT